MSAMTAEIRKVRNGLYEIVAADGTPLAEAQRFYLRDGAAFSGWVIRSYWDDARSDAIPNEKEMLRQLPHYAPQTARDWLDATIVAPDGEWHENTKG